MSANLICIFTARKLSERKFTNTGISCGFVIVSLTFNLWAFLWAGSTQHNKKQNIGGHGRLVYFKTTFWDVKTCRFVHQCILFSWYFPPAQDIKMYILFTAVAPLAWCCSRRQLSSLDDVNQIICCIMRICVCVCVCECACVLRPLSVFPSMHWAKCSFWIDTAGASVELARVQLERESCSVVSEAGWVLPAPPAGTADFICQDFWWTLFSSALQELLTSITGPSLFILMIKVIIRSQTPPQLSLYKSK